MKNAFIFHGFRIIWIIFWVYWFIKAFGNKQTVRRVWWSRVTGVPLLFFYYWVFFSANKNSQANNFALEVVGLVLCLAGLAFCVWARGYLGKNWSAMVTLKKSHELITTGPYALVRHPIYTGLSFALIGTTIALSPTTTGFLLLALCIVGHIVKLKIEEPIMQKEFPEAYTNYKQKTRFALFPFLY